LFHRPIIEIPSDTMKCFRPSRAAATGCATELPGLTRAAIWVAVLLILSLAAFRPAAAAKYSLPEDGSNVVGHLQGLVASHADSFLDLGRRFNVGYEELRLANPGVDPWIPGEGTLVVIPSQYVLPDAPRTGIVLNLAEMRLYYFPEPQGGGPPREVITHPVSIGQVGWNTPLGTTNVVSRLTDPAWYPPASIRAEAEAEGRPLPLVVPPGPDNPLGRHALGLGIEGYLIHGTNKPYGLGMRVSHGCVRMYPEDIASLFNDVPVGTPVHIVNQPIKMGWKRDVLFMEAHPGSAEIELGGDLAGTDAVRAVIAVTSSAQSQRIRWEQVAAVAETPTGMPYAVSEASSVQLALSHHLDLEMVRGRVPVSGVAPRLDAGSIADMRSRFDRGLVQNWAYFRENTRVQ
jgi:L,D-transpeptidase ErfK/SrfK